MKKAIITIASLIAGAIMVDKFITWNNQQKTDEVSASTNEDSLWTKSWLKVDEWTSGKKNPTASKVDLREFLKGDSGLSLLEEFKRSGWTLRYGDDKPNEYYLDEKVSTSDRVVFHLLQGHEDDDRLINLYTTLTFYREDKWLLMGLEQYAFSELNGSLPEVLRKIEMRISASQNRPIPVASYVCVCRKISDYSKPALRIEFRLTEIGEGGEVRSDNVTAGTFDFVASEKLIYKPLGY